MKIRIRSVRLRIRYKRRSDLAALAALILLAIAVPTAAFLTTLAWGQKEAAAAPARPAAFTGMRKYYLTQSRFEGDEALTACAPGYHMASLWEILDPSNLVYNTDLGEHQMDSGAGPPASGLFAQGWVRTGWDSEIDTGTIGQDNCAAWTDNSNYTRGPIAELPYDWGGGFEDMHVWDVNYEDCDELFRVWCVEDTDFSIYLPLVLR